MFKSLGLALLAIASTITYVSACSCEGRTNEEKFCGGFLRLFQIMDNTTVGDYIVFDVQVLETYRTVPITNVDETKLYTSLYPTVCGITLRKDAYYVVSGYYSKIGQQTRMVTGLCQLQLYFASDPRGSDIYEPPSCNEPERPETQNVDVKQ